MSAGGCYPPLPLHRSQVRKTVSSCFAVLRQLRSVRRSLSRSILQTLVTSLVLTRLDFVNATLAGIPHGGYQLKRLQSVMNAAAQLVFSSRKFDHVTPLLRQLHWLKAPERIDYKLAVLVYKCQHGSAPPYLADELCRPAHIKERRCLRSASSPSLICAELGCQPSATWLFRLLPLVSETICHSTSRLQNLCLSSAVASRLISLSAAFRDTLTVVVPEK